MKKLTYPILLVIIGIFAGIYLFYQFGGNERLVNNTGDSLIVSDIYAQEQTIDEANKAITESRRNVITFLQWFPLPCTKLFVYYFIYFMVTYLYLYNTKI